MNSEKLSTVDGIVFELQTLHSAEDEVNKQVSQIIKYTPLRFSVLFVVWDLCRKLLLPLFLFFMWFFLWTHYEIQITTDPKKVVVQSNSLFCKIPENNLRSPSLIPTEPVTSINGTITTFPWSAWDDGLVERLEQIKLK